MENQEPLLENNWRRQLSTADRNILVQKMYEDKHIIQVFNGRINRVMVLRECVIDPTMVDDARLIALSTNFEECVYQNAVSKNAYYADIAKKMYLLKVKSRSTRMRHHA